MSILVIGIIVGMQSLRDSVVTELADVGQAFANMDQSFSFGGIVGHCGFTAGSQFMDMADFCDTSDLNQNHAQHSKCVHVCITQCIPMSENGMSMN